MKKQQWNAFAISFLIMAIFIKYLGSVLLDLGSHASNANEFLAAYSIHSTMAYAAIMMFVACIICSYLEDK